MECAENSQYMEAQNQDSTLDWPKNVLLYQTFEKQMPFSEAPNCLYIEAFLRMCKLNYTLIKKHNAEDMAPSREIPVLYCGNILISGPEKIVMSVEAKGSLKENLTDSEKCEISAYKSLINMILLSAENYVTYIDNETFVKDTCKKFSPTYPWPLNSVLIKKKRQIVEDRLEAIGWLSITWQDVCHQVELCFKALSHKLNNDKYFISKKPTELDALVFAHVFNILSVPLPRSEFVEAVLSYPNIVLHCKRILDEYFKEFESSYQFTQLLINSL